MVTKWWTLGFSMVHCGLITVWDTGTRYDMIMICLIFFHHQPTNHLTRAFVYICIVIRIANHGHQPMLGLASHEPRIWTKPWMVKLMAGPLWMSWGLVGLVHPFADAKGFTMPRGGILGSPCPPQLIQLLDAGEAPTCNICEPQDPVGYPGRLPVFCFPWRFSDAARRKTTPSRKKLGNRRSARSCQYLPGVAQRPVESGAAGGVSNVNAEELIGGC